MSNNCIPENLPKGTWTFMDGINKCTFEVTYCQNGKFNAIFNKQAISGTYNNISGLVSFFIPILPGHGNVHPVGTGRQYTGYIYQAAPSSAAMIGNTEIVIKQPPSVQINAWSANCQIDIIS